MEPVIDTAKIQALDAAHFLHPFTDFKDLASHGSRVMVRGEGIYVWDSEGKRILDAMSGLWCVNVGYGRKALASKDYNDFMTSRGLGVIYGGPDDMAKFMAKSDAEMGVTMKAVGLVK